jgi:hypothetical protein
MEEEVSPEAASGPRALADKNTARHGDTQDLSLDGTGLRAPSPALASRLARLQSTLSRSSYSSRTHTTVMHTGKTIIERRGHLRRTNNDYTIHDQVLEWTASRKTHSLQGEQRCMHTVHNTANNCESGPPTPVASCLHCFKLPTHFVAQQMAWLHSFLDPVLDSGLGLARSESPACSFCAVIFPLLLMLPFDVSLSSLCGETALGSKQSGSALPAIGSLLIYPPRWSHILQHASASLLRRTIVGI